MTIQEKNQKLALASLVMASLPLVPLWLIIIPWPLLSAGVKQSMEAKDSVIFFADLAGALSGCAFAASVLTFPLLILATGIFFLAKGLFK